MALSKVSRKVMAQLVLAASLNARGDRKAAAKLFTQASTDPDLDLVGDELVEESTTENPDEEFLDALDDEALLAEADEDEESDEEDDFDEDDSEEESEGDEEVLSALASLAGTSPVERASRQRQRSRNAKSVQVANARSTRRMSRHR